MEQWRQRKLESMKQRAEQAEQRQKDRIEAAQKDLSQHQLQYTEYKAQLHEQNLKEQEEILHQVMHSGQSASLLDLLGIHSSDSGSPTTSTESKKKATQSKGLHAHGKESDEKVSWKNILTAMDHLQSNSNGTDSSRLREVLERRIQMEQLSSTKTKHSKQTKAHQVA